MATQYYRATAYQSLATTSQSLIDVFNCSENLVNVYKIIILKTQLSAISGAVYHIDIRRTVNVTGGQLYANIVCLSPENYQLPNTVTVGTGRSLTYYPSNNIYRRVYCTGDEVPGTLGNTWKPLHCFVNLNTLWDTPLDGVVEPLVCPTGYGIAAFQVDTSGAASTVCEILDFNCEGL